MARPRKTGLDYFPFDIDFFQDEKIVCIAGEFGIKGEMVAIRLLCAIYKDKGYYAEWNEQLIYKLSKEMQGVSAGLIEQIVRRLAKWGFFDEALLVSASILTSRAIQRRYFEARKRLRRLDCESVKIEYLLDSSVINSVKMDISSEKTQVSSYENITNEIKEKEIKREVKTSQKNDAEAEDLKDRIEKLKNQEIWKCDIAKKYRIEPNDVPSLLDEFHLDMRCTMTYVRNVPALFDTWLYNKRHRQNENRQIYSTSQSCRTFGNSYSRPKRVRAGMEEPEYGLVDK